MNGTEFHPADDTTVKDCVARLLEYCQKRNWAGNDPYDALNSRLISRLPFNRSRVFRIGITQVLKRIPVNVRSLLRVSGEQNPKAISLFLTAFLKLGRVGALQQYELIPQMIERLVALRSPGIASWAWGYSFPWQTRTELVPRWAPNLVCTVFVANALLDAYEQLHDLECLRMAISAGEHVVSTWYWTDEEGIASFSYPFPGVKSRVHNANFLGAALLCRLYGHTAREEFRRVALRVARYSAGQQKPDGSWTYGEGEKQGWVDNFHTGYNLCGLRTIGIYAGTDEFLGRLANGLSFYRANLFTNDGAPKYFHDQLYPIDIHSAAQGIITLMSVSEFNKEDCNLAWKVWRWSFDHMWDEQGYFYYRVLRCVTNKISYMRWSQAWMLLALATLLEQREPA